jgi:uncharacterized protein
MPHDAPPPTRRPLPRGSLLLALGLLAAIVLAALLLDRGGAAAAATTPDPAARTVQVTGRATFDVAPDRATFTVGVERDADEAEAARSRAARDLAAVVAALRGAGLPADALQGQGLRVEPRYSDPDETRVVGYRASADVAVTVDDVSRVGAVIDAATGAGAARVADVTWTLKDPAAVTRAALARAAQDGTAQAKALAQGAGVALGDLQTMEVGGDDPAPLESDAAYRAVPSPGAPSTPTVVPAGTLTGNVTVTMTFALA